MREQFTSQATVLTGQTVSGPLQKNTAAWFVLEVPAGQEASAITIQARRSADGQLADLVTLSDVSNGMKTLTSEEIAAIGPFPEVYVKLGSAAGADLTFYAHCSS